ncbi:hypothetical protein V6N11_061333 [Hibiscus sabdariffa]|uniref:Uncharacterized protein n=1 Tax=Hibiscus sabdariffa TaxID=183260 RepID=A0ABR2NVW1_9ROSI
MPKFLRACLNFAEEDREVGLTDSGFHLLSETEKSRISNLRPRRIKMGHVQTIVRACDGTNGVIGKHWLPRLYGI